MWYTPCEMHLFCENYQRKCLTCDRNILLQDNFKVKTYAPVEYINTSTTPKTVTFSSNSFQVGDALESFNIYDMIKLKTPKGIKVTNDFLDILKDMTIDNIRTNDRYGEIYLYGVPIYVDNTIKGDYEFIW